MATIIMTDSSADFEPQELCERKICRVPLTVAFGADTFLDGVDLFKDAFYARLLTDDLFPTTSQPSPEMFLPHFMQAKENGDDVVAVLLSAALSGTVQSACIAKKMARYERIYIIDSLSAVAGLRLLVDTAAMMRDAGVPARDIVGAIETLKHRVAIFAAVDTLEYLHRGGRLTKGRAKLGQMVSVKPVISLNDTGGLYVADKALGLPAACRTILKHVDKTPVDARYPVFLAFSHVDTNARRLGAMFRAAHPDVPIHGVCNIGPVIGAHLGENAFGIIYVRRETAAPAFVHG